MRPLHLQTVTLSPKQDDRVAIVAVTGGIQEQQFGITRHHIQERKDPVVVLIYLVRPPAIDRRGPVHVRSLGFAQVPPRTRHG